MQLFVGPREGRYIQVWLIIISLNYSYVNMKDYGDTNRIEWECIIFCIITLFYIIIIIM